MNIYYSDEDGRLTPEIKSLMETAAIKAIGEELFYDDENPSERVENAPLEIGVTVVSGEEIKELNREYRGKDSVTDVLSFPQFNNSDELYYELEEAETEVLMGDVVLCYDRAVSQAEEYGTGITREFVYLFVHSILHLMGYDHMVEDEKKEMRAFEEEVMNAIGVTR